MSNRESCGAREEECGDRGVPDTASDILPASQTYRNFDSWVFWNEIARKVSHMISAFHRLYPCSRDTGPWGSELTEMITLAFTLRARGRQENFSALEVLGQNSDEEQNHIHIPTVTKEACWKLSQYPAN